MATIVESHPGDTHEIPEFEPHESNTSLKERIKKHYEIASDFYYSLWYEALPVFYLSINSGPDR